LRALRGRHHAIEHVDARADAALEILRRPDAHQVARLLRRQLVRDRIEHLVRLVDRFADREPTERVAIEVERGDLLHVAAAALEVDATLDDAEQRLPRLAGVRTAALRPGGGARERDLLHIRRSVARRALVEAHHDVGSECCLDGHRHLGCQPMRRAIDVRAKRHAVVVDRVDRGEREHLKSAGVRQDRAVPLRERVQPTDGLHHLETWPKV
jgi:hypothetical protein